MQIDTSQAVEYFKTADPVMAQLLRASLDAPRPLEIPKRLPQHAYFGRIVTSIISQQISTGAAASIRKRVEACLGELTPDRVAQVSDEELRACGLSGQKVKYIRRNAEVWDEVPTRHFGDMTDEEIVVELTKLYGIWRWTAEMFLIFSLARPDVFSYGDLGLMQALYQAYGYRPRYTRKIRTTVENWSPHRTLASLTLWHHKDGGPLIL